MVFRCRKVTNCFVVYQQKCFSTFYTRGNRDLLAYNTQTRRKEPLNGRSRGILCAYICGPTVYDSMHLGHAYSYTQFDIIRRVAEDATDYRMLTCINITDIDDKIIKRARDTGTSYTALADRYEQEFWRVLRRLNIRRPEIVAPVSKYISSIISYTSKLISDGHAYIAPSGSVYFDVEKCGSRYGRLRGFAEAPAEAVEIDQEEAVLREKKNAADFAVWKHARPDVFGADEPQWAVPWDENHRGRPGWHTECAALTSLFFGRNVDIHFGGADLLFPHHENECAQNLCFHNIYPGERSVAEQQWVNHWLHFGTLLNGRGEKMSKSRQNFIGAEEFFMRYGTNAGNMWRMFCCLNHYRSHSVYRTDDEAIDNFGTMANVQNVLAQIEQFRSLVQAYLAGRLPHSIASTKITNDLLLDKLRATQADMQERLLDDFDVPGAVTALVKLFQETSGLLGRAASETGKTPAMLSTTNFHPLHLTISLAKYVQLIDEFYGLLGFRDDVAENVVAVNTDANKEDATKAFRNSAVDAGSYSQSFIERVIDDAVAFRTHVRQAAISMPNNISVDGNAGDGYDCRQVLLEGCDALRNQLASRAGVVLRDSKHESFWMFAGAPIDKERKVPLEQFKTAIEQFKVAKHAATAAPVTKKKIFIKKTKQPKPAKPAKVPVDGGVNRQTTAAAGES